LIDWVNLTNKKKRDKIVSSCSFDKSSNLFLEAPMTKPLLKKKENEEIDRICGQCSGKEKNLVPHVAYYAMCVGTLWRKMNCKTCGSISQEPVSSKEEDKVMKDFVIKEM